MSRKVLTGVDHFGIVTVDPTPIPGGEALKVKMDATKPGVDPTKFSLVVDGWGNLFSGYGADANPGEFFKYGNTYFENGWVEIGAKVLGWNGTSYLNVSCPAEFFSTVKLAADPTQPLQAATKQYVDNISVGGGAFVPLAGGTMTGQLLINMTTDLSVSSTGHPFQIGPSTGTNLRLDSNEIQFVNNGAASDCWFNYEGGKVRVGSGGVQSYGAFEATTGAQGSNRVVRYRYTGIEYYEPDIVTPATVALSMPWFTAPRMSLTSVTDATLTSTGHAFQVGADTGRNLRIDDNEVQVVNNGVAEELHLNPYGGNVRINQGVGGTGGNVNVTGQVTIQRDSGPCISLWRTPSPSLEDPWIGFYASDTTTRYGFLQARGPAATDPGVRLCADGTQPIRFYTAGSDSFLVREVNSGDQIRLLTGTTGYMSFYEGATRRGYMGHYTAGNMRFFADTGYCQIGTVAAYALQFYTANAEQARFDSSGNFMMGKTTADVDTFGFQINMAYPTATTTGNLLNQPGFICNKISAGNAAGSDHMHFRMAGTTRGSITAPTTTTTAYNTSSDYRLKDVLGPVASPVQRLMLLKPCHIRWKENGEEMDTFIAHEVDEVVDWAVTGKKDAVDEDGAIIPQQLDASKLIPLLTAAVQELAHRVADLERV